MSAQSNISEADLTATADDRFDQPNIHGRREALAVGRNG